MAQVKARLLAPGMAAGFRLEPISLQTATRSASARPFVSPQGSANHICISLLDPAIFRPKGLLDASELVGVTNPRRYPQPTPNWFEWIDVYPKTEAAGIVRALPPLISKCAHFTLQSPSAAKKGTPASESAAPLHGLGDQALYVTVRLKTAVPGRYLALDWILIRSDRTLLWIDDQSSVAIGTGHDRLTLELAQDAWRHFSVA